MSTAIQCLRLLGCIALICCFSSLWAQELIYTSGPTRAYSFTHAPSRDLFFNGTEFEWISSRGQHTGLAYFDGVNDSVNLWSYPDDEGRYFPSNIGQRSFSIAIWAQFLDMQSYARLFETSGIYGASDNIAIFQVGTTGNLGVRVYQGTSNTGADFARIITPNSWQHIVLVGDQISLTDSTSNTAANYSVYVNAVRVGGYVGALPRDVFRGVAHLGRSSFVSNTDNLFYRGYIDSVHWYNYQLQDQQVAAHFVCKRPPIFDIAFAENPSQITGITNPSYGFVLTDQEDVNAGIANYRKGLLTFDAASSQYIDLNTNTGSNSLGTVVPTLGGAGYGTDMNFTYNGFTAGWTFECLVKFTQLTANGRVYSFSDGGANDIFLGFSGSSSTLIFSVATNNVPVNVAVIDSVQTSTWYHVVVTITRQALRAGGYSYSLNVFVNGRFVRSSPGAWPAAVTRTTAYLGRSGDSYLGMKLDSMRIFDFALDNSTISNLYITTNSPLPADVTNTTSVDMYSTSPIALYGFDDETRMSNFSNFRWLNKSGDVNGIAIFNGNWNSFIDLSTFSDDSDRMFPLVFGGECSFEAHVQFQAFNSWSRIFDFGGMLGFNDNNIHLGNPGTAADILGSVYVGTASANINAGNAVKLSTWHHVTMTIQQVNFTDIYTSTSAYMRIYIDGVLRQQGYTYLPSVVKRPNIWLARSNWVADGRFRGMMDYFAFYRYTLSAEQVAAHAQVSEPPIFETAFNKDPRAVMGGTGYSYNYMETDTLPNVGTSTFTHTGLLEFTSASSQYVDLMTYQYPNGIGTILPTLGVSSGFGTSVGMSFELLIKFKTFDNGAPIFDFGVGTSDRLTLTLRTGGVELGVSSSLSGISSTFLISGANAASTWYHIIIVLFDNGDNTANAVSYVNGVYGSSMTIAYPAAVNRTVAYLGRNQEGAYGNFVLDAMRIYAYALTADMATKLFTVTNQLPVENTGTPVYSSKAINLYTFESSFPDTTQANYRFMQEVDGRNGVAYFDGQSSFAILNTYTDSYGSAVSSNIGGQMTFQIWIRFSDLTVGQRIFDFSNGVDFNSFNLVVGSGNTLIFTIVGSAAPLTTPINSFAAETWYHISISIAQFSPTDSTSPSSANVIMYVDGNPVATARMLLPAFAERTSNYIGRGIATASTRFHGYLDSFAIYNYPVQPESLKVHMVSVRLPVFELDFAVDPRPLVNLTDIANYGWVATDSATSLHKGLLSLDKSYIQHVNLRTIRGSSTVGVLLPAIGGHFGDSFDFSSGLSIQITFMVRTMGDSTLFLAGNNGNDFADIIKLVFTNGGRTLVLSASSTRLNQISTLNVIDGVNANTWYDVVVTMLPSNNQWTRSTWTTFVNGRKSTSANNQVYPQLLTRSNARLGGSTVGDAFDGFIDSFRIFDHTVQLNAIQRMYALTTDLASNNLYNLGCGYYGNVRSGSLLMSFILQGDIASFTPSFGDNLENALRRALGIRREMIRCQGADGSNGRTSLASPSGAQTLVRTYLLSEMRQTAPDVSYAHFKTIATNGTLDTYLSQFGLPPVLPNSWELLATCPDGSYGDCGSSGSGSSLSAGAVAGIVIGVIVGVILLIVVATYLIRRRSGGKSYSVRDSSAKTSNWESQRDDEDTTNETAEEGGDIEMH
jgi:hypothetical protein